MQHNELTEVAMITRLRWSRRKDFIHGKGFIHPNLLISKARKELELYTNLQNTQPPSLDRVNDTNSSSWLRPSEGTYKLNWDASINVVEGLVGVGAIPRDCTGQVIGTLRAKRNLKANSFNGETYAMMLGVLFCKEIGVTMFALEGDALSVVNIWKEPKSYWSYEGLLIKDARQVLDSFAVWTVNHTKREANKATRIVAKNALHLAEDLYDLEDIPNCIRQIVISDMM
ncbi:uncharacterized protein LOC121265642 [Juglans microcarpa x Juglans regia]|uniref:uncharacterized protein LOC121265642 n=1 Tax=Juglans microcarpa x Juglans regia TaxID=2249226 RepID=UPI001B7E9578|nr:uncharacterized protein LOC121265642 [Juglans microcarpa x Juglans regia]